MSEGNGKPKAVSMDDIIRAIERPDEYVEFKELGGTIRFRRLSKKEIDDAKQRAGDKNLDREFLKLAIVEPVFDDAALQRLEEKWGGLYYAITNVVMDMNGLSDVAQRQRERSFRP